MKFHPVTTPWLFCILSLFVLSCNGGSSAPSKKLVDRMNLKRGEIVSCGAADKQFGSVNFETTCSEKAKEKFNLAIELLHSFEYDESEKAFAKVIDENPECAMAYWGVAMCSFHPLWTAPTEAELEKGSRAIEIARAIPKKSVREAAYINAIAAFYKDWNKTDHHSRCVNYEKAMEQLHAAYPGDKEAAALYALALDASANTNDKTYSNQKKAGAILNALYPLEPNHPGIIHYIIHTYDYPGLAERALPAARKYAAVAPSSAHALHMPSHIFTRLGLWDECIQSNLASIAAAKCYAEQTSISGHWDEELHGLDYLVYAYLQKGETSMATAQIKYLHTITEVYPLNFKVAYAFAAIPSRLLLETNNWSGAATLQPYPAALPWAKFPWQEAVIHFTRLLGNAHLGNIKEATNELTKLRQLRDTLIKKKDSYKSGQLTIQIKTGEAWILFASGNKAAALPIMKLAADMEDSTEKHLVTPGEVLPARELLANMLLQLRQYDTGLATYEAVLRKCPNRFNALYGAGLAAEKSGSKQKALLYYRQLLAVAGTSTTERPELIAVRKFIGDSSLH